MDKNKELIQKFLDFLKEGGKVKLHKVEIANHSSNDYFRDLTFDEEDKLISDFLAIENELAEFLKTSER